MEILNTFFNMGKSKKSVPSSSPKTDLGHRLLQLSNGFMGMSTSGEQITDEQALKTSALFSCVKIISESVASLPFLTYVDTKYGYEKAKNHYLYEILSEQPSPLYTQVEFMEVLVSLLLLYGNSYARIFRDGSGRIQRFRIVHPNEIEVKRLENDEKLYTIIRTGEIILSGDMIDLSIGGHNIKDDSGMSVPGSMGQSALDYARDAIGLALATENFSASFFKNGAHLKGVIEPIANITPQQLNQLEADLDAMEAERKYHTTRVLPAYTRYVNIGAFPNDSQLDETRRFQIEDIARFFRVPTNLLNIDSNTSYSSDEARTRSMVTMTLKPYLKRIEQEFRRKVFTPKEMKYMRIAFDVNDFNKGDTEARCRLYETMSNTGAITPDQIREMEGWNKLTPEEKVEIKELQENKISYKGKGDWSKSQKETQNKNTNDEQE